MPLSTCSLLLVPPTIIITWPPSSATSVSACPLNGTCVSLMPCLFGNHLGAEMRRAAGARGSVGDFARIGLGVVDDVLPLLERRVAAGDEHERVAGQMDDVAEVLVAPLRLLHHRQTVNRDRDLRDRVAVGL